MNQTTRKKRNRKNKTVKFKRKQGKMYFPDFPNFTPNLTPREIFSLGSFGGTYWRPICSTVTGKCYHDVQNKYSFFRDISSKMLSCPEYDKGKNKYKVRVGTSLEFWEGKHWITKYHPYGWVYWYCDFCLGRRCPDDERQIKRWSSLTGPNGRFRKFLITQILKKNKLNWNDETISPKIRQVLQHWAYVLTEDDFKHEIRARR